MVGFPCHPLKVERLADLKADSPLLWVQRETTDKKPKLIRVRLVVVVKNPHIVNNRVSRTKKKQQTSKIYIYIYIYIHISFGFGSPHYSYCSSLGS